MSPDTFVGISTGRHGAVVALDEHGVVHTASTIPQAVEGLLTSRVRGTAPAPLNTWALGELVHGISADRAGQCVAVVESTDGHMGAAIVRTLNGAAMPWVVADPRGLERFGSTPDLRNAALLRWAATLPGFEELHSQPVGARLGLARAAAFAARGWSDHQTDAGVIDVQSAADVLQAVGVRARFLQARAGLAVDALVAVSRGRDIAVHAAQVREHIRHLRALTVQLEDSLRAFPDAVDVVSRALSIVEATDRPLVHA